MIKITINGQVCECEENEYVLNVARANGIFIPALCYVSCASPTLACRLCVGEIDGKRVYTCNAKAKDGMLVITDTPELNEERKAIMQTYCINHPLECGVCDQSGECELQNFVHYIGVNEQKYAIKDTHKPCKKWGVISYSPSLCIVCERCIKTCKDKIGESALKTVPRGGDNVDKSLKESMPKEAFAVWNKFQKNLIAPASGETLECSKCGECVAVCPVGALTSSDFKYKSNAWELNKIPASNPHSSDCELIYYDVKQSGIENRAPKIYRVSNDFYFGWLNGAARFGFDFSNKNAVRDEKLFDKIVFALKNKEIKTIKFNSFITNEEARILELFRQNFGIKLVNDEAFKFQKFMKNFAETSGENLYSANSTDVVNSDFIIVAGSFLRSDAPNLSYKVNNALKIKKGAGLYFHPVSDKVVQNFSKNFIQIKHDAKFDIEILLFILKKFGQNLPEWLNKNLDQNFSELLDLNETKIDEILTERQNFTLIIGEDFVCSKNAEILAKLTGFIAKFTPFKILIIPPRTNSLGVSLICELSEKSEGKTFGYNEEGDYSFGVFKDLQAPALSQQEGTFTNYDKRVVPTNAALPFCGFELNDFAKSLGFGKKFTIDFTQDLGKNFKNIKFDDLENCYSDSGENQRGYELEILKQDADLSEFEIKNENENLKDFIYAANPINEFSEFSAIAFNEKAKFIVGSEFLQMHNIKKDEILTLKINGIEISLPTEENNEFGGILLPYFDSKIPANEIFTDSRFCDFEIVKGGENE